MHDYNFSRSKYSFTFVRFHLSPCLFPAVAAKSAEIEDNHTALMITAKIEESLTKTGNVATRVLEIIAIYNNAPGLGPTLEFDVNYEVINAPFGNYQLRESLVDESTDWSVQKTLVETHYESLNTMIDELVKLNNSQDLKDGMCS